MDKPALSYAARREQLLIARKRHVLGARPQQWPASAAQPALVDGAGLEQPALPSSLREQRFRSFVGNMLPTAELRVLRSRRCIRKLQLSVHPSRATAKPRRGVRHQWFRL